LPILIAAVRFENTDDTPKTTTVTVTWGATSGNVNVKASNNCGSSAVSLSVSVPANLSSETSANVAVSTIETKKLEVFPNPAKDIANISFQSPEGGNCIVNITDISGKALLQKPVTMVQGFNKTMIDVGNFPAGLYIVTLTKNDGERMTTKLIKQ